MLLLLLQQIHYIHNSIKWKKPTHIGYFSDLCHEKKSHDVMGPHPPHLSGLYDAEVLLTSSGGAYEYKFNCAIMR